MKKRCVWALVALLSVAPAIAGEPYLQKEKVLDATTGTWALALVNEAGDKVQAKHVRVKTSAVGTRCRLIRWTRKNPRPWLGDRTGERVMSAWPAAADSSYRLLSATEGENWNTWNDCNLDSLYFTNPTAAAATVTVQWRLD